MSDPGAIRLSAMLDASPFLGGISGMVGGLSKMSNAMKLGSLAVGYFAFKTLKEATKELVAFEMQALELKKVMGGEIAEPVIQSVRELSLVMPVAREQLMNVAATPWQREHLEVHRGGSQNWHRHRCVRRTGC